MDPVRLLVADDEPKLRAAWERVLAKQRDIVLAGLFDSADEICARLPGGESVLLLDLSMPGRSSLEAMAEIRDTKPGCRVIMYSGYSDPEIIQSAIDAGAWAYVDKLTPPMEILDVVRRVAAGEAVFI